MTNRRKGPRRSASPSVETSIAGFAVHLSGAPAPLRRLLVALWGQRAPSPRGNLHYTLLRSRTERTIESPDRAIAVSSRSDPSEIHKLLLDDVFSRIGDAFALHGACLARGGLGVLISGPSGFGKTTLAIQLARRGFDFLSDDLVLVDRRTGRLEPVRRGIHLRAGSRRLLDPASRKGARLAARLRGRDEWTVDPERWLGPAPPCGRIGMVLLLRPADDLHRVRRLHAYELAFSEGRRRLPASLTRPAGLRTHRRSADGRHWRVAAADPSLVAAWIEGRPAGLTGWAKVADTSPGFDGEPRVASIGRFQAAIELAQEMVNRGPGSRLGAVYDGREAELAVDLAARIRDARCYALVPGRLEETLRLIERLGEGISPRPPGRAAPR